jgi:hypothetical protein
MKAEAILRYILISSLGKEMFDLAKVSFQYPVHILKTAFIINFSSQGLHFSQRWTGN